MSANNVFEGRLSFLLASKMFSSDVTVGAFVSGDSFLQT